MRITAVAMACAMTVVVSAHAASLTLDDLNPGKTVNGPDLSVKDMRDKAVLVMYWGTH